nr:FAD-dependent oxidoreductase [Nannocystis sp.]
MTGFRVAVIGGGVSGLTAAHELAERGFQVWVFEGEHDALRRANVGYKTRAADDPAFAGVAASARQPLVGGLAATQWYRIPKAWSPVEEVRPPFQRLDLAASVNLAKPEDWWSPVFEQRDRECLASEAGDARVRFQLDDGELTAFAEMRIGRLAKRLSDLLLTEEADATLEIQCVAFVGESVGLAAQRGHQILLELLTACHRRGLEASLPEDGSRTSVCVRVPRATNGRVFHVNIVQAFVNPIVITEAKERHVKLRLSSASGATISEVSWESPRPKDVEHELSQWEGRWPMLSFTEGSVQISKFAEWRIAEIAKRLKELLARVTTDEYLVIGGVIAAREVKDKIADPFTDVDDLALRRAEAVAEVLKRVCGDLVWESAGLVAFDLKARDKSVYPRACGWARSAACDRGCPPGVDTAVRRDPAARSPAPWRTRVPILPVVLSSYLRHDEADPPARAWQAGHVHDRVRTRHFPRFPDARVSRKLGADGADGVRQPAVRRPPRPRQRCGGADPSDRALQYSLRGLLKMLDTFQEHADVPLRDIILGQLKVVRYATSCAARRDSYEAQTWSQFTESHLGGLEYQRLLDHWPQALVGLQASRADARTTGTVLLQLLLDQVRSSGYRDGTLNAPTSESWLDPWKRYLEHERGVEFVCAKIDEFRFIKDQRGIELINVAGAGCDGETVIDRNAIAADYDYVVIATSVDVTAKLGRALRVRLEIDRPDLLADFERSRRFTGSRRCCRAGSSIRTPVVRRTRSSTSPGSNSSSTRIMRRCVGTCTTPILRGG